MHTSGIDLSAGKISVHLLLAVTLLACGVPARAGEAIFGYTYTTGTEPEGDMEIEQWLTDRESQAHGDYHNLQARTELEYGLTDNWSLSGYLNYYYVAANDNSTAHDTRGVDIPEGHNPARPYSAAHFKSVSLETVYRVLSPYLDPIGLALYMEPELGPRERSVELRLILQKNFLDDRLVTALNIMGEPEWEDHGAGDTETATQLEFDLGLSYRIAPNWRIGLEFRNHNEFSGFSLSHSHQEHTALFLGPTVHYGAKHWWATLTVLPQIYAAGYTREQRDNILGNRIYGEEHTRIDGIRLKVGFDL